MNPQNCATSNRLRPHVPHIITDRAARAHQAVSPDQRRPFSRSGGTTAGGEAGVRGDGGDAQVGGAYAGREGAD